MSPFKETGARFRSRGFLRSDEAYKLSVLYFLQNGQAVDDQFGTITPSFDIEVADAWAELPSLEDNPGARGVHILYDLYEKGGDPILYHSTEINGGSSGGGVFVEVTGHLLGTICTQAGLADPGDTFLPAQSLYRIDHICAQSGVLSDLSKCRQLLEQVDN